MNATALRVTGPMIAELQTSSFSAALVEIDGRLQAIRDLPTAHLADEAVVLRTHARQWANELVDLARLTAEEDGTPTRLGTLRAAAGRLATDELAEERARELVVATPRRRPVLAVLPRQRGRHAALPTPMSAEAESSALCQLLDELDEMGLLSRAA